MVGVNFAPAFLRPDGKMIAETDIQLIVDHFKYFIDYLGEEYVGFGSDFDGAMMPKNCLLYTSPSPRDATLSRMPSSA